MRRSTACFAFLLIVLILASFAMPSALPVSAPPAAAAPAPTAAEVDEPPATAPQNPSASQAISFVQIAAGVSHTCGLTSTGLVYCWGSNDSGQLGDGTTTNRRTPVAVSNLSGAIAITAGAYHACALLRDGTTRCWGSNDSGQLGDGTRTNRWTPVAVSGLSDASAIAAGGGHTCALLRNGTVRCWGSNVTGQLGDGTTTNRWTPVAIGNLSGVAAIAAGEGHTCALLRDGTVRCWGWNNRGQLGDGTTTDRWTPVPVSGLSGTSAIATGFRHTCALLRDGTARCWGWNSSGQLGDSTTTNRPTPVAVSGLSGAVSITASGWHTCALLGDGTARCWGLNSVGELGDGTTADRLTPVAVSGLSGVVAITAGDGHTCAVLRDGTAHCWGSNAFGQLGNGTTSYRPAPATVNNLSGTVAIAAGSAHACALLSNGTVRCWGWNRHGQIGDGTTTDRWTPAAVSGLSDVVAIAIGGQYSCALLRSGAARCWGYNETGQLGDGTTTNRPTPAAVSNLSGVVAIAAGGAHACALLSNGTVRCWGYNESGQLGDGTTTNRLAPVAVSGLSGAVAIAAGAWHTCALLNDGTARCWGYNESGQLGDGTTTNRLTPAAVSNLSDAVAIAAGERHTCALLRDGAVRCWGYNVTGQLGDGTTTNRLTPAAVSGLSGANAIAVGSLHTCALLSNSTVRCWGLNKSGQLGDGTTTDHWIPAAVSGLSGAVSISAGGAHTCAHLNDGTARCWGYNSSGQLGDGTAGYSPVPVTVAGSGGGAPPRPLIFIPGIMGSYLDIGYRDIGLCNLWPGFARFLCPSLSKQLLVLPETVVVATDAIRQIAGLPGGIDDVYHPLLEELTRPANQGGLGLVEYRGYGSDLLTPLARCERAEAERRTDVTLFVFAYDWRQDNAAQAHDLAQLVACIRRIHGPVDVDILTHSMGGLIARKYITDYSNRHHVRKLVTIAAPWLGAPKALVVMETGWFDPKINALFELDRAKLNPRVPGIVTLKLLAETFPSVHQLLPSRASIDILGERPLREDGRNLNSWWPPNDTEAFTYDQYVAWLDSHYLLSNPGSANQRFHTVQQDDWRDDQSGVQYIHVYGRSDRHDTPRSLRAIWRTGCVSQTTAHCLRFPGWDVDWTWGDGTVPAVNARRCRLNATNPDECAANSPDLNAPGSVIIPVTPALGSGSVEHTDLVKNAYVINQVINALRGSTTSALASTSATTAVTPASAYYLDILGLGRITIADALGNTTDTISGTLTARVPDVMYTPMTDLQHVAVLPATQSYTITFRSSDAPMLITVRRGTGDTADAATRFLDVSVPPGTQLQLRITPQGIEPLRADNDGNGTFETEIPPTASVTGAAANDLDAPAVTISATGPLDAKTVTITATDSGAGVKQTLYSLDGTTFQPYTAPFVVDATQTPVVYAFADDNVANRSSLLTERLAWPIYLPLTVR